MFFCDADARIGGLKPFESNSRRKAILLLLLGATLKW
jgi:hypothetical protein